MGCFQFLILLTYGLVVCILPNFILLEFFHWIMNKKEVKQPILKCVLTNLLIGIVAIILWLTLNTSAEAGMAFVALQPVVFAAFALGGIILGLVYRHRGTPFLVSGKRA